MSSSSCSTWAPCRRLFRLMNSESCSKHRRGTIVWGTSLTYDQTFVHEWWPSWRGFTGKIKGAEWSTIMPPQSFWAPTYDVFAAKLRTSSHASKLKESLSFRHGASPRDQSPSPRRRVCRHVLSHNSMLMCILLLFSVCFLVAAVFHYHFSWPC